MKKFRVRTATPEDIPELERMDTEVYPEVESRAKPGSIRLRVMTYPKGVLVCTRGVQIVAAAYLRPLAEYDKGRPLTWKQAENGGDFTPHATVPTTMYGVGLVSRDEGAGTVTAIAAVRQCANLGVKEGWFASRIPTWRTASKTWGGKIHDYVMSGKDWEVRLYGKMSIIGLKMATTDGQPVVIENYFSDPDSLDFGLLWRWENPFRGWPFERTLSWFYCSLLMRLESMFA